MEQEQAEALVDSLFSLELPSIDDSQKDGSQNYFFTPLKSHRPITDTEIGLKFIGQPEEFPNGLREALRPFQSNLPADAETLKDNIVLPINNKT